MNTLFAIGCVLLVLVSSALADHPGHEDPSFCTASITNCKMAGINVTCVAAQAGSTCVKDVAAGKADMALATADNMVQNQDNLMIVVGEKLKDLDNFVRYYGLAVVKKGTPFTYNTMKGRNSCHTGVGKTVGWKIPVGNLLSADKMNFTDNQYKSASDFFGQSCAPGIRDISAASSEVKNDLCRLCNGTCALATDRFANYNGAFICMAEGNKDRVGFVRQTTAADVFKMYPGKYGNETGYELLCINGGKKPLNMYKDCFINSRPSSAIVANKNKLNTTIQQYVTMLKAADVAKLKSGGIVNTDTESLQSFTGDAKKYVGNYGDSYNALMATTPPTTRPSAGSLARSSFIVSVALQLAVIFAVLFAF